MKRTIRSLCLLCTLLLCLPLLAACDSGKTNQPDAETTETESVGSSSSTESNVESTADTEAETDAETEAETQPEPTGPKSSLSFTELSADIVLSDYFVNTNQCAVSLTEQGTLCLTTANTPANLSESDPYVHLLYGKLLDDLGYDSTSTRSYSHMVLRVRSTNRSSNLFSLFGFSTNNPKGDGLTGQMDAYLGNSEDWQYLYFDLSSFKKNLITFRFDMSGMAAADGEVLEISDITFYETAEQAQALLTPDYYPVIEQSADDYVAKIMSFNVQTENGTQVRADIRMTMLRTLIDEYRPDSIGLQEVTTKWSEMMAAYCFNQSYACVGEPRTKGGEANLIYYRSDKFELVDSGTFWLSETPDVEGSALAGVNYPRICTWAHLRDKVTGKEYVHLNTHLDHNGNNDSSTGKKLREAQFTVILKFMQRFGDLPMVVTGDLNQGALTGEGAKYAFYKTVIGDKAFKLDDGTEAYSPLANTRFDAPDNMPEGQNASQTAYLDPANSKYNPAKEPIDYVLYTDASLTALSYRVRLYDVGGLYLSDHLPVIAELKFAPTPAAE